MASGVYTWLRMQLTFAPTMHAMRTLSVVAALLAAGCSPAPRPQPVPAPAPSTSSAPAPIASVAAPPPVTHTTRAPFPSIANASAADCVTTQIPLGPGRRLGDLGVDIAVDLDARGGIAVWSGPSADLRIQRFDAAGKPIGEATSTPLVPGQRDSLLRPSRVVLLDHVAVVIVDGGQFDHRRYYTLVVDRSTGLLRSPLRDLELNNQFVNDAMRIDGTRFVLLATRGIMAPDPAAPGHWAELEVSPTGEVKTSLHELSFSAPVIRIPDQLFALRAETGPMWIIRRYDREAVELVAGGKIEDVPPAELAARGLTPLLRADSEITWIIAPDDGAVVLTRVHGDEMFGEPTRIPDPQVVGFVDGGFVADRFFITYTADDGQELFPRLWLLDCRP